MRRRHGSSTPTEDSHAVKPRSRAHARNWRSRSSQPGPGSGSYELIDLGLGDKPIGQSKPPRACLDTATPMRIIALTSSCFEILKQLLWPDRQGNLSHSFTVPDQRKHLPARRLRGPSTGFAEGVSMSARTADDDPQARDRPQGENAIVGFIVELGGRLQNAS